jgi:hypothetical protein
MNSHNGYLIRYDTLIARSLNRTHNRSAASSALAMIPDEADASNAAGYSMFSFFPKVCSSTVESLYSFDNNSIGRENQIF